MTSARGIQVRAASPHQALPVNSQVFPVSRHVPSPPVVVRVARSCSHIRQNPSDGLGSHPLTLHLLGFFFHVRICFKLRQLKLMACEHLRTLPN